MSCSGIIINKNRICNQNNGFDLKNKEVYLKQSHEKKWQTQLETPGDIIPISLGSKLHKLILIFFSMGWKW